MAENSVGLFGWEVPPGFTTFEIVEPIKEAVLDEAGSRTYRLREHHVGVGHTAHLPDGGRLTLTPGDRDTYTAAGYYLAAYDAHDDRLWGRRFDNVHAALTHARNHLREAELPSAATPIPYPARAPTGAAAPPRSTTRRPTPSTPATHGSGTPHHSARAWEAQAERIALSEAPTASRPSRPEGERRREAFTTGHDQNRTHHGDPDHAPRAAVSHVPRVDCIHDADLHRILGGEPEPDTLPDVD